LNIQGVIGLEENLRFKLQRRSIITPMRFKITYIQFNNMLNQFSLH